jgi:nicotinamide-nucleotide amidase
VLSWGSGTEGAGALNAVAPGLTAAVVTVGNELLYGETVDTNAAWLARSLAALGAPVVRKSTVGDVVSEIQAAVRAALESADLVLVSGGLGPTADDVTKQAVAEMFARPLAVDAALLERLEAFFRARGLPSMPALNLSQAEVPEGARVLRNSNGTAPGLALDIGAKMVVLLPGVPRELRGIFDGDLRDCLIERFGPWLRPVHHRLIHTTGIAESMLAELLEAHLPQDRGPVTLAYLPDLRGVDLRLSARGVSADEAEAWFLRYESAIGPVVAKWRFAAESGDAVEALNAALARARKRVAVAESCTGGLIAKRITDRPGSSEVFVGGVIAYDDAVKVSELGVSQDDLRRHGAVSEPVARQMARGVAERLGAHAGIGITGIAGPGGGTPEKPVGTVWLAIALDGVVDAHRLTLVGNRDAIRERAAQEAIARLYRRVIQAESGA